jgi:TRAP-type C4-dicarboxylate transport system permease large subunit
LLQSALTTGVIMVMLYTVMILSRLYIMEDVPGIIMDGLTSLTENRYLLLLIINLFMIMIGMLMDDVSAVLLCTPMLLPLAVQLDLSPIHFAAVVGVNLGLGNVTPPTAPLLYLSGQLNGARINETLRPTLYLILFAWIPTLLLTTFIPELSLWLPKTLLSTF